MRYKVRPEESGVLNLRVAIKAPAWCGSQSAAGSWYHYDSAILDEVLTFWWMFT